MKKIKVLALACATSVISFNSWATNFSYSSLDLEVGKFYSKSSLDQGESSMASLKVGYELQPNLFTRFTLKGYSYDQGAVNSLLQVGLGLGAAFAVSNTTDIFGLVELGEINLNNCGAVGLSKCHDSYVKNEVGLRHWLSSTVEWNIAYHYYGETDITNAVYEIPVGVSFWLDPRAALKLGYVYAKDTHGVSVGYEYSF